MFGWTLCEVWQGAVDITINIPFFKNICKYFGVALIQIKQDSNLSLVLDNLSIPKNIVSRLLALIEKNVQLICMEIGESLFSAV